MLSRLNLVINWLGAYVMVKQLGFPGYYEGMGITLPRCTATGEVNLR